MKAFLVDIETPPGLPWTQEQVARLEAQHRSPMASAQVEILLRRQRPWRIGAAGLFQGAVVRRSDLPVDQSVVEIDTDGGPVAFPTRGGGSVRALAPAMAVGLLLFASTAVSAVAVWRALEVPEEPARAVGVTPTEMPRPANDHLIEDLLAIREAFGGQGLRGVQWRPGEVVVLADRSSRATATGRGRAFEKLPPGGAGDLDRWRLGRARSAK